MVHKFLGEPIEAQPTLRPNLVVDHMLKEFSKFNLEDDHKAAKNVMVDIHDPLMEV